MLNVKWLNIYSICKAQRYVIGKDAIIESVYYFSALAYHLNDPIFIARHKAYIKCRKETGVEEQLSRFKRKKIHCSHGGKIIRHEEQETDMDIASKMFYVLCEDKCDSVVLVTGDTDLSPAAKTAQLLFPSKQVIFAFPFARSNKELAKIAPGSFKLRCPKYVAHQFPDPFPLSNGSTISKPLDW